MTKENQFDDIFNLYDWLRSELQPICDAPSDSLAQYVRGLVNKPLMSLSDIKKSCLELLEAFLGAETAGFVDKLIAVLESKQYIESKKAETDGESFKNTDGQENEEAMENMKKDTTRVKRAPIEAPSDPYKKQESALSLSAEKRKRRNSDSPPSGHRGHRRRSSSRERRSRATTKRYARKSRSRSRERIVWDRDDHKERRPRFERSRNIDAIGTNKNLSHLLPDMSIPPPGFAPLTCSYAADPNVYNPEAPAITIPQFLLPQQAICPPGAVPVTFVDNSELLKPVNVDMSLVRFTSKTLQISNIPSDNNTVLNLATHFGSLGRIKYIEVNFKNKPDVAVVAFFTKEDAIAAYKNPKAVLGNRFTRVHFKADRFEKVPYEVQEQYAQVQNSTETGNTVSNQLHNEPKLSPPAVQTKTEPAESTMPENTSLNYEFNEVLKTIDDAINESRSVMQNAKETHDQDKHKSALNILRKKMREVQRLREFRNELLQKMTTKNESSNPQPQMLLVDLSEGDTGNGFLDQDCVNKIQILEDVMMDTEVLSEHAVPDDTVGMTEN